MPNRSNSRHRTTDRDVVAITSALFALVAIDLFVFAQVVDHEFISLDDSLYVTDNAVVQRGLTWAGAAWAFTTNQAANWHPLTWLSHMLDVSLFGTAASGHHATNLLFHVVSTLLLFLALRSLTGATGRSAFVAALFGAHPLHVESVAWVAERKDVLSSCFLWLVILAYTAYVRRPSRQRYAWIAIALALGLLTKPMLVTAPLVLLLLDVWPLERARLLQPAAAWRPLITEKWPLFALVGASIVVTVIAQQSGGAVATLNQLPLYARVENAALSYVAYLGKAVWPSGLSVFYEFPMWISFQSLATACAVLGAITAIVYRLAGRYPYLGVGWLWYLGTLVPVIGIVQVGSQGMADRYTYVPLVGIFIALAWGVPDLVGAFASAFAPLRLGRRWAMPAAAAAIVATLAVDARAQVGVWTDDLSLWANAVAVEPRSAVAHASLGAVLGHRQRWDQALTQFVAATTLNPELPGVRESLAVAHHEVGLTHFNAQQMEEAVQEFSEAIRIDPLLAAVWNNRGLALATLGRIREALSDFTEAVRLQPDFEAAHFDRGLALRQVGRINEARLEFLEVLRLNPKNEGARRELAEIGGLLG